MKRLRTGYTTGTCAAAAAKGALLYLMTGSAPSIMPVTLPDGEVAKIPITIKVSKNNNNIPTCYVIKDAGDDPDVTNGIEIAARVYENLDPNISAHDNIIIYGGKGVGIVTKKGLPVKVGEYAINPVPRLMIISGVKEVFKEFQSTLNIKIEILVPLGEAIAKKTLNERLGIVGGISILGTSGVVHPVSSKAWKDTVVSSMNVASKSGVETIVLSTGRTSEKGMEIKFDYFKEESFILMGDHLRFSLESAQDYSFKNIYYAGMWAKVVKAALHNENTHVRHGVLKVEDILELFDKLGASADTLNALQYASNGRDVYERLVEMGENKLVAKTCSFARDYLQKFSRIPVNLFLVSSSKKIVYKC